MSRAPEDAIEEAPAPAPPTTGRLLTAALALGVVPSVLALALGVLIAASVEETVGDLTRDLTVTTGSPLYVGALSSLTVMVWTAGAAVALATAWPARRAGPLARLLLMLGVVGGGGAGGGPGRGQGGPPAKARRPRAAARLLLMLGVLGLALAVDDQFMVHDGTLQKAGIPGEAALAAYAAWLLATVLLHRDLLRHRPETGVLALAAAVLAASLVVDLVVEWTGFDTYDSARILVEDGLKLIGAAVWGVGLGALARAVQRLELVR